MVIPGNIWIGTSNVHIPGNKQSFPPAFRTKSRLHYYSHLFNTVEINSCFYKIPQASTYAKWTGDVPADFRFSIKLIKDATHNKGLETDFVCVQRFFDAATGTGDKKGAVLVQFPGKISIDYFTQVENILEHIMKTGNAGEWRIAVEFRNPSWYIAETVELLDTFHAALVLHDHPKARIQMPLSKANFVYMRLHGPSGNYRDSYSAQRLEQLAGQVADWSKEGKEVYVYFNNTAGDAFNNARSLQAKLGIHLPA